MCVCLQWVVALKLKQPEPDTEPTPNSSVRLYYEHPNPRIPRVQAPLGLSLHTGFVTVRLPNHPDPC